MNPLCALCFTTETQSTQRNLLRAPIFRKVPPVFSLKDKNAIVTGGGSGIGLAISQAFAKQGACVDILEVDAEAGIAAVQAITDAGGLVATHECDVTNELLRHPLPGQNLLQRNHTPRHFVSGHNHARTTLETSNNRSSEILSRYVAAMLVSTWPMITLTATWSFDSPAIVSNEWRVA